MMPPWYGDMHTGDRVTMTFINPPLAGEIAYPHARRSTTTVTGVFDRISMEPVEGYPWNATPHACSIAVIEDGWEARAPITQIVSLNPATVETPDPKGTK